MADTKKIKQLVEDFFERMTFPATVIISQEKGEDGKETFNADIKVQDPQVIIGERGQTLIDIQRLLRNICSKALGGTTYLNIDINEYKKKKVEYLKALAKDLADEVTFSKKTKILLPMSSYERRVIHTELANRTDITTTSEGEEPDRHVVIKPK